MVLLFRTDTPMSWRTRLLRYSPGIIVGLGLALVLRSTSLNPATGVFLSSLPMWFLLTLASELGGPANPWPKRLLRSVAYALLVSSILYWIM
jgi:hypothetical protein